MELPMYQILVRVLPIAGYVISLAVLATAGLPIFNSREHLNKTITQNNEQVKNTLDDEKLPFRPYKEEEVRNPEETRKILLMNIAEAIDSVEELKLLLNLVKSKEMLMNTEGLEDRRRRQKRNVGTPCTFGVDKFRPRNGTCYYGFGHYATCLYKGKIYFLDPQAGIC